MADTNRIPIKTTLSSYPANVWAYFECLSNAGAAAFCLYGGALRDADCAKFYGRDIPVNDYDMRVWLPESLFKQNIASILKNLTEQNGAIIEDAPRSGKNKPRFKVKLFGNEIDLSFRAKPDEIFTHNASDISTFIAQDRTIYSNVGLSAIALDKKGQAWVLNEYLEDRCHLTMTVSANGQHERNIAYAQRLTDKKYPMHTIVEPK